MDKENRTRGFEKLDLCTSGSEDGIGGGRTLSRIMHYI